MKKIIYCFLLCLNIGIAQSKYQKLAKDFKTLSIPYISTKDYFPIIGYDASIGREWSFVPGKGGIMKEVTANFKVNYGDYYEYSRYFSLGKIELKNTKALLYYEVQKSNKNGSLRVNYEMIIFNKNNKIIAHKYIAGHNHVERTFIKPKLILDSWQQSRIYIEGDGIIIVQKTHEIDKEYPINGDYKIIKNKIHEVKYRINQDGTETPLE